MLDRLEVEADGAAIRGAGGKGNGVKMERKNEKEMNNNNKKMQ